ncbi:hypothetical protein PVAND_000214 [Polypedilum vanderplanki]|uniref:Uncharacterized protein n=1 Tax=Polypedilum vanderplanki TaxID=319348 RepID=A0A9J6BJB5_POLVA|nr:hypothetical protein PVAND_000214 [Polypedilum vanderplanki]
MIKAVVVSIVIYFFFSNVIFAQDPACKDKLKNILPMEECCDMPDLLDEKMVIPIIADLEKKYNNTPLLLECLIDQEIMKKIGLEKIEKASAKKLAQGLLKGSPWLAPIEAAIDECVDRIPKFAPVYQKSYNLPKEKCDAQYAFFNDCIESVAFSKCLPQNWTTSEKCEITKKFVVECQNDEAMIKFTDMQRNFF